MAELTINWPGNDKIINRECVVVPIIFFCFWPSTKRQTFFLRINYIELHHNHLIFFFFFSWFQLSVNEYTAANWGVEELTKRIR
jgi:hypothetical protein